MGFSPVGGEAKAAGRLGGLRARGPRGMEARSSSSSCACESTQEGGGHGSGGGGMPRRQRGQQEADGRREGVDPAEGNRIRWIPAGSDEGSIGGELHGWRRFPAGAGREGGKTGKKEEEGGEALAWRRSSRSRAARGGGDERRRRGGGGAAVHE